MNKRKKIFRVVVWINVLIGCSVFETKKETMRRIVSSAGVKYHSGLIRNLPEQNNYFKQSFNASSNFGN